jgi:hypothetical protein
VKTQLRLFAFAAIAAIAIAPASGFAADKDDLDWRSNSHLRLGGGWYASPWEGVGLDGFQLDVAYHYELNRFVMVGPTLSYAGMKAEIPLSDLPVYADQNPTLKLRVHQTRLGLKALASPIPRVEKARGRHGHSSLSLPFWPYGALDTGIAIHYLTERDEENLSVSESAGDWYIKPGIGVLFSPQSPLTVFMELGYTLVPTYEPMAKRFNYYGAPERMDADLNTDGFVLEAGVAFQF